MASVVWRQEKEPVVCPLNREEDAHLHPRRFAPLHSRRSQSTGPKPVRPGARQRKAAQARYTLWLTAQNTLVPKARDQATPHRLTFSFAPTLGRISAP